jgi:hypothetical protein
MRALVLERLGWLFAIIGIVKLTSLLQRPWTRKPCRVCSIEKPKYDHLFFAVVASHRFSFLIPGLKRVDFSLDVLEWSVAAVFRRLLSIPSYIDYVLAISWPCNVLDRLSPFSVLTVVFQVHRPARSAPILA